MVNISLGGCVPKCMTVFNSIHISRFKQFHHKTVIGKVQWSHIRYIKGKDSKPYNNPGKHFKKQVAIWLLRLRTCDSTMPKMALHVTKANEKKRYLTVCVQSKCLKQLNQHRYNCQKAHLQGLLVRKLPSIWGKTVSGRLYVTEPRRGHAKKYFFTIMYKQIGNLFKQIGNLFEQINNVFVHIVKKYFFACPLRGSVEYNYTHIDCSEHKRSISIYFRFWFILHSTSDFDEPYKPVTSIFF